MAKGYTQIFGRDYDRTYSPVMDSITYRYMISFALHHKLVMHLMDVVTTYLYGILDTEIYLKAPPELIDRVAFHIKGEKHTKLSLDLLSGIQLMTPTEPLRQQVCTSGPPVIQQAGVLHTPTTKRQSTTGTSVQKKNEKVSHTLAVRVLRSINGLKQSGRIWYKRF